MGIVAIIPVAQMAAANAALEPSWGPLNFSVPAFGNGNPTHGCLHDWGAKPAFVAAIKAQAGVTWNEGTGDPAARLRTLLATANAQWGAEAPPLPSSGMTVAGRHYRFNETELWLSIVAFDRSIWTGPPSGLAASIIRRARWPGEIAPWVQPIDAFNAYRLVNPFTGQPDMVLHLGQTWRVTQGDGSGNNVWEPGVFGWELVA